MIVIAAGILLSLGVVAIVLALGKGSSHTVHGVMVVGTSGCSLGAGYEDISEGTGVTISNAGGTVVATSNLGLGVPSALGGCEFDFTAKVPDSTFYKIEVSHRGQVTFSKSDLASSNWEADLTLGTSG